MSRPSAIASAIGRCAGAATYAALNAPTLVPTTIVGRSPRSSSTGSRTDRTPISYAPRAPPPERTSATSAIQDRPEPHDRRALLHGHLEVLGSPHRQLRQAMLGRQLGQPREMA